MVMTMLTDRWTMMIRKVAAVGVSSDN